MSDKIEALREKADGLVKPLEWRAYPDAFPPTWLAKGLFTSYSIEEVSGSDSPAYDVFYPGNVRIANVDGLPEAKVAAQADYERRILSALDLSELDRLRSSNEAILAACEEMEMMLAQEAANHSAQNDERQADKCRYAANEFKDFAERMRALSSLKEEDARGKGRSEREDPANDHRVGHEAAAAAAFRQAQSVYRADHDHFPLRSTWRTTDESVREGWRKIAAAALSAGKLNASKLNENDIATALAPFFEEGWTARDGARAVLRLLLGTNSRASDLRHSHEGSQS